MSDLAARLVDAAEKEIPYFCDVDEYIRQGARAAVASTLKLFAAHLDALAVEYKDYVVAVGFGYAAKDAREVANEVGQEK